MAIFRFFFFALGLTAIAAAPFAARADADPNRPTALIARDLGITDAQFKACFLPVRPAPDKDPSGQRQRMNKSVLLPCLQKANPGITNDMLDRVMDRYRPEGPIHR